MKNFKTGYSWMPAAHDGYPGWEKMSIVEGLKPAAFSDKRGKGFYVQRNGTKATFCYQPSSAAASKGNTGKIIFDKTAVENEHLTHIMFNASEAPAKPKGTKHDRRLKTKKDFQIFQDSGGYQLVSGAKDFVDPYAVAAAHNLYAHEGVGLDIPTGSLTDLDLMKASAQLQVLNNRIIHKELKNVSLFATSQGVSAEARKLYLEILLDSDFEGICIAGLRTILGVYSPTLEQQVLHLIYVILTTKKRAARYHVLGVSTFSSMLLLACVARHYNIRITSDSARHILTGAGGVTLSSPNLASIISGAGTRKQGASLGVAGQFLKNWCSCGMCSSMLTDHLFSESRFLQTHAFNSICQASTFARNESEFLLNHASVGLYGQDKDFVKAIKLLQTVNDPKEAIKLLAATEKQEKKKTSLFQTAAVGDVKAPTSALLKQMWAVVDRYKEFHRKKK